MISSFLVHTHIYLGTREFDLCMVPHEAVKSLSSKLESGQEILFTWIQSTTQGIHYHSDAITSSEFEQYCFAFAVLLPERNAFLHESHHFISSKIAGKSSYCSQSSTLPCLSR